MIRLTGECRSLPYSEFISYTLGTLDNFLNLLGPVFVILFFAEYLQWPIKGERIKG